MKSRSLFVTFLCLAAVSSLLGPKRLLFKVLFLYRRARVLWLSLKGSSEKKEIEKKIVSGRAWEDYCDALKAAGTVLLAPGAPNDPFTQAEGYRYLTRLLRVSLTAFMECRDYENPQFISVANGKSQAPVKLGADNPDSLYQSAVISPRYGYLVTVKLNSVPYLGVATQAGNYGSGGGFMETIESKDSKEFAVRGGVLEVFIGPFEYNKYVNYLPTKFDSEEAIVVVRQTFLNAKEEEEAELSIKKIGEFDEKGEFKRVEEGNEVFDVNESFNERNMLTCEHVAYALNKSAVLVGGASALFAKWAFDFKKHPNELPMVPVEKMNAIGGDPSFRYFHSFWKMEEDEALVVTLTPPNCRTWVFQVNNYWMEVLDHRYFRVHLNKATANYNDDGTVTIIICLKNPKRVLQGNFNWLTTTGHTLGTMSLRLIKPESFENIVQPKCQLFKFKELGDYFVSSLST